MIRHSCIYQGNVRHRRFKPVTNSFSYNLFLFYIDLAETHELFGRSRFFSNGPGGFAAFCSEDHLGDPGSNLADSVRELVLTRTGRPIKGPIRLLTHLRYAGYCFNPVSFYYCYDKLDTHVEVLVAEVNNTPWKERHCYVLDNRGLAAKSGWYFHKFPKVFHVSPFFDLTIDYDWHFREPGDNLNFHMIDFDRISREKLFDATLALQRVPATKRNMLQMLLNYPLITARVVFLIHYQALRLWWKGVSFFVHPSKRQPPPEVYHVHHKP